MADLAFSRQETEQLVEQYGVLAGRRVGRRPRRANPRLGRRPALRPDGDRRVRRTRMQLSAGSAGDSGDIADYLTTEILQTQAPEVRDLLLRTCVVDVLQPGLIEVLGGRSAGPGLAALAGANILVEEVAGQPGCYRYHPFLRDLLRAELAYASPNQLNSLRRRAANWFAQRGAVEEAVALSVASAAWADAAGYVVDGLAVGRLIVGDDASWPGLGAPAGAAELGWPVRGRRARGAGPRRQQPGAVCPGAVRSPGVHRLLADAGGSRRRAGHRGDRLRAGLSGRRPARLDPGGGDIEAAGQAPAPGIARPPGADHADPDQQGGRPAAARRARRGGKNAHRRGARRGRVRMPVTADRRAGPPGPGRLPRGPAAAGTGLGESRGSARRRRRRWLRRTVRRGRDRAGVGERRTRRPARRGRAHRRIAAVQEHRPDRARSVRGRRGAPAPGRGR